MRKTKLYVAMMMTGLVLSACGAKEQPPTEPATTVETTEETTEEETTEEETTEEETTEEETTEEETTEAAVVNAGAGVLTDNLYDFQLEVDGQLLDFPMTYDDFISYGFVCHEDDTRTLSSQQYGMVTFKYKDNVLSNAYIINGGNSDMPYNQCVVAGLSVDAPYYAKNGVAVKVTGGLDLSSLTQEQVETQFGAPTDSSASSDGSFVTLRYVQGIYDTVSFKFSNGEISEIVLQNLTVPEDMFTKTEVNTEVPGIVQNYQAPTEISNELTDYTFSYAGDLYQLPVPVQSFLDNGWTLVESGTEATVVGKSSGWVEMMKDNQSLRTLTTNYTGNEVPIANCFVTQIDASQYGPNVEMTLSRGITMGMSQEDLEAALDGVEYQKEDNSSYVEYVMKLDDPYIVTTVYIVVREGKITGIELNHAPKKSEFGE